MRKELAFLGSLLLHALISLEEVLSEALTTQADEQMAV